MTKKKNVLVFFEVLFLILAAMALVCAIIDIVYRNIYEALIWAALMFGLSAKSETCHLKLGLLNRRSYYD